MGLVVPVIMTLRSSISFSFVEPNLNSDGIQNIIYKIKINHPAGPKSAGNGSIERRLRTAS